eukprot:TRINITY_DN23282_c0_g1_i1.p1 TRINITY_DN23282_c0_g1~~TRINITY_DN23282_c0_g1_i1.p1  ORF type:complete len:250 (+),score=39.78 TRINITY_DN23282_c0_g1_i1:139-888(+)
MGCGTSNDHTAYPILICPDKPHPAFTVEATPSTTLLQLLHSIAVSLRVSLEVSEGFKLGWDKQLLPTRSNPDASLRSQRLLPLPEGEQRSLHLTNISQLQRAHEESLLGAAKTGDVEAVRLVCGWAPFRVNESDPEDLCTALHHAVNYDQEAVVKVLLSCAQLDLEARDKLGSTALLAAVSNGQQNLVAALIQAKANVNVKGRDDCTPLFWAESQHNTEIADMLKRHNAYSGNYDDQRFNSSSFRMSRR